MTKSRAQLRGKPLDKDCYKARISTHEYGPNDNRKSQIRIATNQENQRNQKINTANTSGKTGVCLNKKNGKWRAYIMIMNRQKSLGHYENYDDAVNARIEAEKKYFKEFRYIGGGEIAELS